MIKGIRNVKIISLLVTAAVIIVVVFFVYWKTMAEANPLDPHRPILLTFWHYRVGTAKAAMDEMIAEFNDTVGADQGVVVEAYSNGNIAKLAEEVYSASEKELGSKPMPDLFTAYNEQAYRVEKLYGLVDLEHYFTEEELGRYQRFFLESGRIGEEKKLKNLPVAKSGECIYLNLSDWEIFAKETGVRLSDLETFEGINKTAQIYYTWSNGNAFWGAQDIINFMKSTAAMEREKSGEAAEGTSFASYYNEEAVKKIWNYFYIPYIKGYYSDVIEKSQSMNAIKQGDLLMTIASTAGAVYFPKTVLMDIYTQYEIRSKVLPYPYFEGEKKYVAMRGNNVCITKSDYAHEYAAALFLKWFTSPEQNIRYTIPTGYLPVETAALEQETSDSSQENPLVQDAKNMALHMLKEYVWYDGLLTEGNYNYDTRFKEEICKKAEEDKAAIEKRIAGGEDREMVIQQYTSDLERAEWYEKLVNNMDKN